MAITPGVGCDMKNADMSNRILLFLLGLMILLTLTGCSGSGSYVIQGRAIRGEFTSVSFVQAHDRRLQEPGVSNVAVSLYREPNSLGRELTAQAHTDDRGDLSMPVDVFGAGWLVEQWLIHTYRPGYQSASTLVTLPKAKQDLRLLITLGPGLAERPPRSDELIRQLEHFK